MDYKENKHVAIKKQKLKGIQNPNITVESKLRFNFNTYSEEWSEIIPHRHPYNDKLLLT